MKKLLYVIILLPLFACVSSKNIAETRNAESAYSNHYEMYQLWRELDINRFTNNLGKIKITVIPEKNPLHEPDTTDQIYKIYTVIKNDITRRDSGFAALKMDYFNASDSEKVKQYIELKSDQKDREFLSSIDNNPYYELYQNIERKTRKVITASKFYSSQKEFEAYLKNRSFNMVKQTELDKILSGLLPLSDQLTDKQKQALLAADINYLIRISAKYNMDFSDRAQEHVGSDKISLKLIDVQNNMEIAQANIIDYWGNK